MALAYQDNIVNLCGHACRDCAVPSYKSRMRALVATVAAYFELDMDDLLQPSKNRRRHVTDARLIASWLLLEQFPNARLQTMAEVLGYRERSGPSHAATYLETRMEHDTELRTYIDDLRRIVAG